MEYQVLRQEVQDRRGNFQRGGLGENFKENMSFNLGIQR